MNKTIYLPVPRPSSGTSAMKRSLPCLGAELAMTEFGTEAREFEYQMLVSVNAVKS